ncbi:MAG: hypothetical protein RDU24_03110 [Humidesulfovibrio sp.]|uniref:tetratricopeptide repeat protein n=1 Tax=Humidesulfovibrio sp. TaxID=2910988 RepID=UPI0027FA5BF6|nr:hypothetical protein [Humidesulfovibrio sp.]MDQ7834349.1 hypothetical protein [Humidesulfovibrio sp.]
MNHPTRSPQGSQSLQGPLVLVNFLNYGHFPSYAANFTRWALARGLDVVHLGLAQPEGSFARAFAQEPRVRLEHPAELGVAAFDEASGFTPGEALVLFDLHWRELLAAIFSRYPGAQVLLLNGDRLFFETDACCDPQLSLPGPVWPVVTFGHREVHTGLPELYTRRLNALLGHRQGFRGVLSIDELHVRARDPEEQYLHLLPDPYREFLQEREPATSTKQTDGGQAELEALCAFLDRDQRPVLPLLGKFDRRKNNLWILRAAATDTELRLVVLGQRVPDPETDPETDALLAELNVQGRLFARFGYVAQSLFEATLASPRTACLALPYSNHYGSSGIQLMGAEYGLPVLVPDLGLMAWRVDHNALGRTFTVGDFPDFATQLALLAREGRKPYTDACARFMAGFGFEPLCAALDKALLGIPLPANALLVRDTNEDPVDRALIEDNPHLALELLERRDAMTPDRNPPLRRAALRWRVGDVAGAAEEFELCRAAGLMEERMFLTCIVVAAARHDACPGDGGEPLARMESWLAALFRLQATLRDRDRVGLVKRTAALEEFRFFSADDWEWLGGMYVRAKELRAGEECFRQALLRDPDCLDYYLTLSDVLRYQARNEESLAMLDALAARAPEHHGLRHKRGQVYMQLGQAQMALALFLAEPKDSPHWRAAQEHLARLEEADAAK